MKHPIRSILAAVDFSKPSEVALAEAIDLASALGAKLCVFHAFELPVPAVSPYEVAIPEAYLEASRKAAERQLDAARERAEGAGVATSSILGEGTPSRAIADAARETGADLIVIGTHGHTGLAHLFLGSVAERTVRHAPCSVLTVKPTGD